MKGLIRKSALALALLMATATFAAGGAEADDRGWHAKSGYEHCDAKKHGHGEYAEWKKTLSDEQTAEMKRLKLALKKELAPLKAKVELKEVEIRNLVAGENPNRGTLSKLIDEVSALKKDAMKARYEHMIKVRSLLTPEQKAAFDMSVVTEEGHGEKHRW